MFSYTPYIECRLSTDTFDGNFSNGLTMTRGETTNALKPIASQNPFTFTDDKQHLLTLRQFPDGEAIRYAVSFENQSNTPATIEMISSFACNLGLLDEADELWRLQSFWSAEGKIKVDTINDLHLIPSWSGCGVRSEKFFNLGSMPVRKYFPFAALRNSKTGEFIGITLDYAGSWQFELLCCQKKYYLACGIADYDTGHFCKTIQPGERFETPQAIVAVGSSFDEVCRKLLTAQHPNISPVDSGMDILFNEFCTTWGKPSQENLHRITECIKGKGISYLVIDAGWFKINDYWYDDQGDWNPSNDLFPTGLKATADEIRTAGMIPGIWFELEVTGSGSYAHSHYTDHMLKRNGRTIAVGPRHFWDMTDPWVIDYLTKKVIHLLRDCGFGYLKIDYNDSIGVGCDGFESLGEGLRRQVYGTMAFFSKIKEELPELVIELCSSGGHRLVPQMLSLVSQASFSDAHETTYIPIIAANLQRIMLPKQSQIWAVLRASDDQRRLEYSLINTLLGRMCLSGDIYDLSAEQWKTVENGIAFYKKAAPIIQYGTTACNICTAPNLADPHGNQLVIRTHQNQSLAIAHRFADSKPVDTSFLEGKTVLATYGIASGDFTAQAWLYA